MKSKFALILLIFNNILIQYVLREKSLAIIYNGVSHRGSLKHSIFLNDKLANMSIV